MVECILCGASMQADGKLKYFCSECGTELDGKDKREITVTCDKCGILFQMPQNKILYAKLNGNKIICRGCK